MGSKRSVTFKLSRVIFTDLFNRHHSFTAGQYNSRCRNITFKEVQTCITFSSSSLFFLSTSSCFLFSSISALLKCSEKRDLDWGQQKMCSFTPFALAYISPILTVFCPLPPVCVAAHPSPSSSSLSPSPPQFFWASRSLLPPASSSAWRWAAALSVSPAPRTLRRSLSRSSSVWPGEQVRIMREYGHKMWENFSSLSNCLIYSQPLASVEFKAMNPILQGAY